MFNDDEDGNGSEPIVPITKEVLVFLGIMLLLLLAISFFFGCSRAVTPAPVATSVVVPVAPPEPEIIRAALPENTARAQKGCTAPPVAGPFDTTIGMCHEDESGAACCMWDVQNVKNNCAFVSCADCNQDFTTFTYSCWPIEIPACLPQEASTEEAL